MLATLLLAFTLVGCGGSTGSSVSVSPVTQGGSVPSPDASSNQSSEGTTSSENASSESASSGDSSTSGPAYALPEGLTLSTYNAEAAEVGNDCAIDISSAPQGYVGAAAISESRLKFQVVKGDMSYNYDLPGDGTPIIVPLNMGSGAYTFRIMQNTSGNNYVELFSVSETISLVSETAPFLVPNIFVDYGESSAVVAKARELASGAANQGDVVRNVYQWVVSNITYDYDKAAELASVTGYVPNPDETLATRTGICFDYASLGAAMLRSLGIPCQVITGYVSPNDVYHAWNMVYIDGEWVSVEISIKPNSWTRVDLTFAASGASNTIGDGTSYTDRYTY